MSVTNHKFTVIGNTDRCQARCACKQKSPIGNRGDAESWMYAHLQEIERTRARLGTRTPTLKTQHAWFVQQAENTDNEYDDRVLWRQLADETERHLNRQVPLLQTETLF